MAKPLRVGIIGASASGGWAKESHVPAAQRLPGLELTAVATRSRESADAAAEAFGANGYADPREMVRSPDIDIVTVAVRVQDHRDLVLAALDAGKHVYCEWPLGTTVTEAEELRDAAARAGVKVAVGVQSRYSPAVRAARDLIAGGAIGRVLTARHYSSTVAFGPKAGQGSLHLEDPANGMTLAAIHLGHALDTAVAVLGGLADVTALATTQYPEIQVGDTGRRQRRSIPDHVTVVGRLAGGAALSAEVAGGRPKGGATPFRLDVFGEAGTLALEGGAPRGFQSGRIALSRDGIRQSVDEGETAELPDAAANVGAVYAALRDDVARGTSTAAGFDHAVRLSRLISDATAAAEAGARKSADSWPRR